jgi:hypothetical protein
MPKKMSPPVELDVPFDGALERSPQADPVKAEKTEEIERVERRIASFIEALEDARHESDQGAELWYARDLMRLFEYGSWSKFRAVVQRGWVSCGESGINPAGHFVRIDGKAP